ncbi:MAG TPA: hypothetical protein EYP63_07385 [Desulfotomaculum sp.]|nr:hypothetical protein [Desulfotomaculum sp.]
MTDTKEAVNTEEKGVVRFFKRYRRAIAVGGISAVVLLAGLGAFVVLGKTNLTEDMTSGERHAKSPATVAGETYAYLPATTRATTYAPQEAAEAVVKDPFAGPMALLGVVLGGRGGDLALIEAGGYAYVAAEGEKVAGIWEVAEITEEAVLLKAGERERRLELTGRKQTAEGGSAR